MNSSRNSFEMMFYSRSLYFKLWLRDIYLFKSCKLLYSYLKVVIFGKPL